MASEVDMLHYYVPGKETGGRDTGIDTLTS